MSYLYLLLHFHIPPFLLLLILLLISVIASHFQTLLIYLFFLNNSISYLIVIAFLSKFQLLSILLSKFESLINAQVILFSLFHQIIHFLMSFLYFIVSKCVHFLYPFPKQFSCISYLIIHMKYIQHLSFIKILILNLPIH